MSRFCFVGRTSALLMCCWFGVGCVEHVTTGSLRAKEPPAPHLRDADARRAAAPAPSADTPGGEITLSGLLSHADRHSPRLLRARALRARSAAVRIGQGGRLRDNPEVSLALGPRLQGGEQTLDVEASLSQRIPLWGGHQRRGAAAEAFAELTEAEIEAARWGVHCDVHAAFHAALLARERARLAERVLAFEEELLKVTQRQVGAGEAAPLTARLAEAEVAGARQALVQQKQRYLAARLELAELAGWSGELLTPHGELDEPDPPPALPVLLAEARRSLPARRVQLAAEREASRRAEAEARSRIPAPALGVAFRQEGARGGDPTSRAVLGTVAWQLPVLDTGQGRERALAEADRIVARQERQASDAVLELRVERARSEVAAAAERVKSFGTEVLPKLEENLAMLRRSFELGEIDFLQVSLGRERFLQIQSQALDAHLDYYQALAQLEREVGADLSHDDQHEHVRAPERQEAAP